MRTVARRSAAFMLAIVAGATASEAGEVVQVKIDDLAFSPAEISVKVGDTVEWVNVDFIDHTATEVGEAWDVMLTTGKSATREFPAEGTFSYFCRYHPNMTGTIHVVAKAAASDQGR